jgi:hypothetical protein
MTSSATLRRGVIAGLALLAGCGKSPETGHPDEAAAVAAIRRLGGQVEFNAERRVIKVYLHTTPVTDDDLAVLETLPKLQNVFLGKTQIGDAGVSHLSNSAELKTLSLNSTRVTDDGVKSLGKLKNLKTLNVQDTKVTAQGASQLNRSLPDAKIAR